VSQQEIAQLHQRAGDQPGDEDRVAKPQSVGQQESIAEQAETPEDAREVALTAALGRLPLDDETGAPDQLADGAAEVPAG
jgi:hypothetical protein